MTRHQVIGALGTEVQVEERQVTICIDANSLTGNDDDDGSVPLHHSVIVPARLTRRGQELRMAYPPGDARASTKTDVKLVGLIAKAEAAHRN